MSILIKDVKRNNNEIIRIEVSEFKGRELINIRIWYQTIDHASGDVIYKPTQKGVALNINEYEELKDGIDKIGEYIKDSKAGTTPDVSVTEGADNNDEDTDDNGDDKKD